MDGEKVIRLLETQLGGLGSDCITDTANHFPEDGKVYACVQVIAEAVIASYTPLMGGNALTGVTLPSGSIICGRFTSLQLTSGKVIAYNGV